MANRQIEELIHRSRLALTNGKNASLQAVLTPFGYDLELLDIGLDLVNEVDDLAQRQQDEYSDQFVATNVLEEKVGEARAAYLRHVKLARVAFKRGQAGYVKLDLRGDRRDDRAGWLAQARHFYMTLRSDSELLTRMTRLTVDEAAVTHAEVLLDEVDEAAVIQQKERGEAQQATRQRDDAAAELRGFMRDFYRVAEVATEGTPQLREQLGMVEPA